ncbi:MAG: sigma-70 family RNA polymerase sigma factor [Verrucomicrobiota bacterium]
MANHNQLTEFSILWTEAQPSVMAFIRSVTPQLADAEDILQETARQIASRFEEYDPERPFGAWAMGVAKFKVMEWRRRQKKAALLFDEEAIEAIHFSYTSPDSDWKETGRAIDQCLKKASPVAEKLLVMRYLEELKPAEIARRTNSSANSVSVRLTRARDALKECLERRLKEARA